LKKKLVNTSATETNWAAGTHVLKQKRLQKCRQAESLYASALMGFKKKTWTDFVEKIPMGKVKTKPLFNLN